MISAAVWMSENGRIFISLLDDTVVAAVASMNGRVRIRRGSAARNQVCGERCPFRGRPERGGELHRVRLAGNAEPGETKAAGLRGQFRYDRFAESNGQVVNDHDSHHARSSAGGEVDAEFHGARRHDEA